MWEELGSKLDFKTHGGWAVSVGHALAWRRGGPAGLHGSTIARQVTSPYGSPRRFSNSVSETTKGRGTVRTQDRRGTPEARRAAANPLATNCGIIGSPLRPFSRSARRTYETADARQTARSRRLFTRTFCGNQRNGVTRLLAPGVPICNDVHKRAVVRASEAPRSRIERESSFRRDFSGIRLLAWNLTTRREERLEMRQRRLRSPSQRLSTVDLYPGRAQLRGLMRPMMRKGGEPAAVRIVGS
jgi:hypothetical protein